MSLLFSALYAKCPYDIVLFIQSVGVEQEGDELAVVGLNDNTLSASWVDDGTPLGCLAYTCRTARDPAHCVPLSIKTCILATRHMTMS